MNVVFSVFQNNPSMDYLMCFFHVMTNVAKRLKGFPSHVACTIVRGLYDLHFARDQIAFFLPAGPAFIELEEVPGAHGVLHVSRGAVAARTLLSITVLYNA